MDVIACLTPFFPEDVVRCITSYLVMKIPRDDPRYIMLARRHEDARRGKIRTLTWKKDGAFRGYLISFSHAPLVLLIQQLPYYIMYQLQNMITMEYTVTAQ